MMKLFWVLLFSCVGLSIIFESSTNSCFAESEFDAAQPVHPFANANIESPSGVLRAQIDSNLGNFTETTVRFLSAKSGVRLTFPMTSQKGSNGRYILKASWTPDSKYFAFSTFSASGHSSWNFRTFVYSAEANRVVSIDDKVRPVTDHNFEIQAPHTIKTKVLNPKGIESPSVALTIDLARLFEERTQ